MLSCWQALHKIPGACWQGEYVGPVICDLACAGGSDMDFPELLDEIATGSLAVGHAFCELTAHGTGS